MLKKVIVLVLLILTCMAFVFAEEPWYIDKVLKDYEAVGLQNVSSKKLYDTVYPYLGQNFSYDLFPKIEKAVMSVAGIDYIEADVSPIDETDSVKLTITYHEIPMIGDVKFNGNNKVKSADIIEKLKFIAPGMYADPRELGFKQKAIDDVSLCYEGKGFEEVPIDLNYEYDKEKNIVNLNFEITEGIQTVVSKVFFVGNEHVSSNVLKKKLTQKTNSLFNNGYLDYKKLENDQIGILDYYATLGYIDARITDTTVQYIESNNKKYNEVYVTFEIEEGEVWYYSGVELVGNNVYTDDRILSEITLIEGKIINMDNIKTQFAKISDLYYNNGYIMSSIIPEELRDYDDNSIKFRLNITEGTQAFVEKVIITGMSKTKEYVFKREVTLKEGEIFSKADLVTSAQNIYNTGLLTDINYDIQFGEQENGIVVEFKVTEGNQMDIQFGATFGGNVDGFPISGFLSWSNHNLMGRAKDISVSTNLSPDTQTVTLSLGDNWFKNKRWANSISLNFAHRQLEDQLREGALGLYNGRNDEETCPLGYNSPQEWIASDGAYPGSQYLGEYKLITIGASYDTGYTFISNIGRLSVSGGLSSSINKAFYDESEFKPYEKLIKRYHEKWQFSNKINLGLQWDGRDYVTNTTKGYVLGLNYTYAGGILQGISNYQKVSLSGAGYFKVASLGKEEKKHNLMFCASTNGNIMLPQYYNDSEDGGKKFHDPHYGATKYEMLYIDGMTIARGHDTKYDQVFLWDNMIELGYPLAENVVNFEVFASGTAIVKNFDDFKSGLNWYFSAGAGIKLKIQGFPLGLYLCKTATKLAGSSFEFQSGSIFKNDSRNDSGMKFVLAISTSLI